MKPVCLSFDPLALYRFIKVTGVGELLCPIDVAG
jgi:hypothetical protein